MMLLKWPSYRGLAFLLLLIFVSHYASSFTAPLLSAVPSARYNNNCLPSSPHQSSLLFANNNEDNNDEQPLQSIRNCEDNTENVVTVLERVRVLSYRAAIGASALLISFQAVGDSGFLEGTGVDITTILDEQSIITLPIVSGITLLLAPMPSNQVVKVGTTTLGGIAVLSGLGSSMLISSTDEVVPISWSLAMLALIAINIREIWYFGISYKVECLIALCMLPLMLNLNNHIPFTIPICALAMCVLAGGKVFEPCNEDLVRSNSEFMAK